MNEYVFKRVTPADYHLLKELYLNAYNIRIDICEIERLFDTTALGCEQIGYLAIDKKTGTPASFYGVFPHLLSIKGSIIKVCQAGSAMTHTEHRNKGLFIELAKKTFSLCRENDLQLVYGFPNEKSYHGHTKKLQWIHIDNINRWDIKLRLKTIPLPKIALRLRLFRSLYLRYSRVILKSRIVKTPESFHNSFPSDYGKVYRDKNYLKYKEADNKLFIKVDNQQIWIKLTDVFWIGDFGDYADLRPQVIKKIKRLAFFLGYNTITFHINDSLPLPSFFSSFRKYNADALCTFRFTSDDKNTRLLFTGADFDTW